jgi:biopolymer transport protein ExbB
MAQLLHVGPAGARKCRRWVIFALTSAFLTWLAAGGLGPAMAQDQTGKAQGKEEAGAAAPDAAPAPSAAAPAPPAPGTAPPTSENLLSLAIRSSGWIGAFLFLLSIFFVAQVIRLFMEFRLTEAVPAPLVDRLETAIRDKKFQDAYDACKDNDSFLARLVRTGIANLPNGRAEAKEAMLEASEEIVTRMDMKISYLAIIGTLGPMIGLVGTIWGMIMSFREIALAAGAQPQPHKVAEGISTALFITLEGVSLSVPAIFFFAFFRNRIAQMTMEATRVADRTINSLIAAAKSVKSA